MQDNIPGRSGVELESLGEAIVLKISFSTEQCQTLPRPPTGFMSDKGILGGKVANAVYIHQEALHLSLQPVVMLVVFLMQGHEKLSVIEHTRSLPRPWSNGAFCGFSTCTASVVGQWIDTRSSLNTFNILRETLTICIVKI